MPLIFGDLVKYRGMQELTWCFSMQTGFTNQLIEVMALTNMVYYI